MNFENIICYIREKHSGQKRIGGEDYINHPIAVADIIKSKNGTEECIATAYFHDILEDTDGTEDELLQLSNQNVVDAVRLLTKYDGYIMEEYMENIHNNDIALPVKLADRIHNLRCAPLANEAFKRKYIIETEAYYVDLSMGTIYEKELMEALVRLKESFC